MLWIKVLLVTISFGFMEFMAWFTHKYVMHGFLWVLHKDHHAPQKKRFERNDFFALMFAIPSIILIIAGSLNHFSYAFYIGLGIALYGLAYFLFHDVLVHQRIKLFGQTNSRFLKAIIEAHFDHHRGKKNYGFLFMVPKRYFKQAYRP